MRCIWKGVTLECLTLLSRCLFSVALALLASPWASAQNASTEFQFDIPAQSLSSALDAFSEATGILPAYNGNLSQGHLSSEVKGRLPADVALPILLEGTGLIAEFTTTGAFVIIPGTDSTTQSPGGIARAYLAAQEPALQHYSGIVQATVTAALCERQETRPGEYRLALSFRIGSTGRLLGLRLLGTSGDERRDEAVVDALRGLSLDEPPPPHTAQPFTMIVLPRSSGGSVQCASDEGAQHRG